MAYSFKEGDLVKTNYHGSGEHASNLPNGSVFQLGTKYRSWDGDPAWWDPARRYYWKEKWLLPAEPQKKSGFAKFMQRIENGDK